MPRLAPNSCNENRMTFGTAERKMLTVALQEARRNRTQKYITAFALPLTGLALATGLGIGGYFIGQKIADADPLAKLEKFGKKTYGQLVTGEVYNSETDEFTPYEVEGATIDDPPVTNPAAGLPIVGSLFGLGMKYGQWAINLSKQSPTGVYYEGN